MRALMQQAAAPQTYKSYETGQGHWLRFMQRKGIAPDDVYGAHRSVMQAVTLAFVTHLFTEEGLQPGVADVYLSHVVNGISIAGHREADFMRTVAVAMVIEGGKRAHAVAPHRGGRDHA